MSLYVSLYVADRHVCTLQGHLHRMTYASYRINTIVSPDDEHSGARNM
jgi:hypothetical protein